MRHLSWLSISMLVVLHGCEATLAPAGEDDDSREPAAWSAASSLWSNAARPAESANDGRPLEVGVKFQSDRAGTVTALRFYKPASATGKHLGHLWTADGKRLAELTFVSETASGWQQASFQAPVAIEGGKTYVASYYSPSGDYAATSGYFVQARRRGSLVALMDGTSGGNGVYVYGASAFPTQSWQASNYWVDLVFAPRPVTAPDAGTVKRDVGTPAKPDAARKLDVGVPVKPDQGVTVKPDSGAGSAFPGAGNTGVPAGVSLTASGSITSTANGQVIDQKDVSGTVTINHSNVTVKRCRIRGSGYQVVLVKPGVTGVAFEDCEVDGQSSGAEINGPASFYRCNIHHISGIVPGSNGTYRDSWVHDIKAPNGAHTECFRVQGGQVGNRVVHNTLDMTNSNGGTAVVFINAYWGNIADNIFDGNLMIGGSFVGYTVYSTSNPPSACSSGVSSCVTTGTQFINNVLKMGAYGHVYPAGSPSATTIKAFSNNRDQSTNAVIPVPSYVKTQ